MNITPLAALPFTTAPQAPEPAAPGGSEADHGVALEFAALLAGLLRTPVAAPPVPVVDAGAGSVEAEEVGSEAADQAASAGTAATTAESDEQPPAEVAAPHLGGWAMPTASGRAPSTSVAEPVTPVATSVGTAVVTPVESDGAGPVATVAPAQATTGAAATTAPQESAATTASSATEVSTTATTVPVTPVAGRVIGVEIAAPPLVDPMVLEAVAPAPPTPESGMTPAVPPGIADAAVVPPSGVAAVVVRIAEAVVATVRQLLGQDPVVGTSARGTDGAEASDTAQPEPDGRASVPARSAARMPGAAPGPMAGLPGGMPNAGGGDTTGGQGERHAGRAGGELPTESTSESARHALADLARLAGAASAAAATTGRASTAPTGGVAPAVAPTPDQPPAPPPPQTVTVRFDGPTGSEHRIRVSIRGDLVHATILTDAQSAPRLEQSLPELQRALADRGFSESRVSVRIMASDGSQSPAARTEAAPSDASRQRDGQGRSGPERDFAGDDRPRGKRHQTGEEAHT